MHESNFTLQFEVVILYEENLSRGIVLKIYLFLNPVAFFSLCLLSLPQNSKGQRSLNASKQKGRTIIHEIDTQNRTETKRELKNAKGLLATDKKRQELTQQVCPRFTIRSYTWPNVFNCSEKEQKIDT